MFLLIVLFSVFFDFSSVVDVLLYNFSYLIIILINIC